MKHRPKHILEYWVLRGLVGLLNLLPERLALGLGWLLAGIMFHLLHWRTAEADRRLRQVFGDRFDARERRRIAWLSLRNLCFNAVDAARFGKLTRQRLERTPMHGTIVQMQAEHERVGAYIIATAHLGAWELSGVAIRLYGVPVFSIVGRQKNPLTNALLVQLRKASGMEVVPNDDRVVRNVVRRLKAGQVVGMLPDVRARSEAFPIRFLNGSANLGAGVALFAQLARCPIYPAFMTRHGWTRHEGHFLDPIYPDPSVDKKQDRQRILQEVVSVLDRQIQAHPEQYFWFNKRWVLDPI